jgi:hypothetical protein
VEDGHVWRVITVTFPAEIHTHSRRQVFYVGDDGLIRRHDYTAEEFGHGPNQPITGTTTTTSPAS